MLASFFAFFAVGFAFIGSIGLNDHLETFINYKSFKTDYIQVDSFKLVRIRLSKYGTNYQNVAYGKLENNIGRNVEMGVSRDYKKEGIKRIPVWVRKKRMELGQYIQNVDLKILANMLKLNF